MNVPLDEYVVVKMPIGAMEEATKRSGRGGIMGPLQCMGYGDRFQAF